MSGGEIVRRVAAQFEIGAEIRECAPLQVGHINETSVVGTDDRRFLLQRINRQIFPDIAGLMENVQRVTEHLRANGVPTLDLVPALSGEWFHRDMESADCWRMYRFVEDATSFGVARSAGQAQQAASAFGQFTGGLTDLPAPRLHEILPGFHDTPKRFADFLEAVESDDRNRASTAGDEIEAAMSGSGWMGAIAAAQASGAVPERIAHNDAKIENVLFDRAGETAVCVVDLDTVMPGSLLHDFGDLVRSAAATAGEEERDPQQVDVSMEMFAALARGFVASCGAQMVAAERQLLAIAGKIITYEQSLRFLTDYLNGDPYYRIRYPEQNLDRARNQLRLVACLEEREEALVGLCERELEKV